MITENRVRIYLSSAVSRLLLAVAAGLVSVHAAAPRTPPIPGELLDAGRADDALRLLTPQATGNNAAALQLSWPRLFRAQDWDNAVRNCERAVQLDPNNAVFQLWLGRSYGEKANVRSVHFRLLAGPQDRGGLHRCARSRSPEHCHCP